MYEDLNQSAHTSSVIPSIFLIDVSMLHNRYNLLSINVSGTCIVSASNNRFCDKKTFHLP